MKSKRATSKEIDWNSLICPITHALPTEPVMAGDGKVYEKQAWKQYVKTTKPFKSPWTRQKISKIAYSSHSIKQILEQAVQKGCVPDELSGPWKQKLKEEKDLAKLKTAASKKPDLLMTLGDHYYNGTGGAIKDLEAAFNTFKKGYSVTGNGSFFVKMMLLNTLRPKRTRTDIICAWSSLCNVNPARSELAAYTVSKVLEHLSSFAHGHHIAEMCDLSSDFVENVTNPNSKPYTGSSLDETIANACAKEIASFLKKNAKGHHGSDKEDEDEEEEDDEDEEEDDDSSEEDSEEDDSSEEDD